MIELYSHEWGVQRQFFWPRHLGPWGGQKVKYLISITKSISKIVKYIKTLCVFSQMKDTKHIRSDIHPVALVFFFFQYSAWPSLKVVPQGWNFGELGMPRGSKFIFFKHGHVAYQIDWDDEQKRMQVKFSSYM